MKHLKIIEIKENKKEYLDLLFLADEQEDMIDRYLSKGTMYILEDHGVKGECVVLDAGNHTLEIKNIAVAPAFHGKGYGKAMIEFLAKYYQGHGVKGECVVLDAGNHTLEIKNIAVAPAFHGKGYGKAMIEFLAKYYQGKYTTLLVGTASKGSALFWMQGTIPLKLKILRWLQHFMERVMEKQ